MGDDEESAAPGTTAAGGEPERLRIENDEYVYLSIVTQVPFWADHKAALEDFGKVTGAKTSFIGPPDFDVAAQARQLDELVARKPAGIILFIGDADAMTPGIDRAVDAGIPVILVISDAPKSKRFVHIGIDGVQAGKVGAELLAEAIGGKGEVILGTFPSPNVLDRVKGYEQYFKENHPEIKVVATVNDKADPSFAPEAYAAAIAAHPNVVGIGGTDGDSGLGAARAVREAGKAEQIKIVAMDRNDDMLAEVENGPIIGSVVQKSYDELWLASWMLYWLNHEQLKPVPDWEAAGINPLPEQITTGVWKLTRDNVGQFKH
ncbi:MAG: substrate-binding domain-containing protein [Actinobacteria bacterium]|nr:substrate-binding domain-containing protein [Actinomycetota bacterium]